MALQPAQARSADSSGLIILHDGFEAKQFPADQPGFLLTASQVAYSLCGGTQRNQFDCWA